MAKNEFLTAEGIKTYRMHNQLYDRFNEATSGLRDSQHQIYKQIDLKITEAIQQKGFPLHIISKWKKFLDIIAKGSGQKSAKKLGDDYGTIYPDLPDMIYSLEVFDEIYQADSLTMLSLFWQKMLSTRERREFLFELYFSIMGHDKKMVRRKKHEKYFYYCWYDKITDKKVVREIVELHDKYSCIEKDIEGIRKNIQLDMKMPPRDSFAPVTLMIPISGPFTEENTWFVPFDAAISSLRHKTFTDEEYGLFDNPLGIKSADRIYIQINVNYDKKTILQQIDALLSKIKETKGTERGKGKRQSALKDEQEKLIEEKFMEYFIDKRMTESDSLFEISMFFESKGKKLEPESIDRRYLDNILKKHGVDHCEDLRKIDSLSKRNETGGMGS